MLSQAKAEEIFTYGSCSQEGKLSFLQFILALRGFVENDIHEWFKIAIADE